MHSPAKPFAHTSGPPAAPIVLVGEAWGENEAAVGSPFVGWSGLELSRMCYEAGLVAEPPLTPEQYTSMMLLDWWKRQPLLLTNVFAFRPKDNKMDSICGKKADVGQGYVLPPLGKGGYILPEYLGELGRLREELEAWPRNCVIALGAVASWALLAQSKITSVRGVASSSTLVKGIKVLPTYHPAGVLRNWTWRPIAVADLMKVAQREGKFPEVKRPERQVLINPTITEVRDWLAKPTYRLSVDLETKKNQIEMVGLARSRSEAIVIPFVDMGRPGRSYWPAELEVEVWRLLKRPLEDPGIWKVFQNGLFDLQYFWRRSPIRPKGCYEDSMLLSHSLFPEMQKGLGFLGSIHTSEASWKLWRGQNADIEELKRDE